MEQVKQHIILCHGLNNSPKVMESLVDLFDKKDFITHSICLTGHGDSMTYFDESKWLNDIKAKHNEIVELGATPSYVGYSLGCLLHHAASHEFGLKWKHTFYFGPALFLKPVAKLIKLTYITPKLKLKSYVPEVYRAHNAIHAKYYQNMTRLQSKYSKLPQTSPIQCIMSKKDEVISYKKTKQWLDREENLHLIKNKKVEKRDFYHLVVNSNRLSKDDWMKVNSIIDVTIQT